MSTNERDTHFQGFAELLVLQIDGLSVRYKDWPDWRELDKQIKLLIAQRAYDLVYFSFREMRHEISEVYDPRDALRDTPDLTAWPEPS